MTILALETSCDETAVAILRGRSDGSGEQLLASEVASQIAAHEPYGGIVPEIASRNHLIVAPRLVERAASTAKMAFAQIDAFAATSGPGLASSLMIGASMVKGMAIGFCKPYLAVNHLEGHMFSPFFARSADILPPPGTTACSRSHLSLIVSGGHTMLVHVKGLGNYRVIARTVDDAAGEAFDKVAKMLGLGYPGGPEIEKRARGGDRTRFDLPRSMLDSENFSFSGLKTAVRYLLEKLHPVAHDAGALRGVARGDSQYSSSGVLAAALGEKLLADLCASFQQAVIDVLVKKTIAAARKCGVELVTASGGVSCNQELRRQLARACEQEGFEFRNAEPWLCTDNAAMIGFVALLRLRAGLQSPITEEIDPNLALA